ncbi:MAG: hypothetical protein ABI317_12475 [Gaiellales bacterium]
MTLELDKSVAASATESMHVEAGMRGSGEYRCAQCGYGIVTFAVLPSCPMCHGANWKRAAPLPEH